MTLQQLQGRIWLGRIKTSISRTSAYFSYINFGMLLLTFYSVTGYRYAPLWLFLAAALAVLITIATIDFFIILPSEQAFINQQFARHQNPIYELVKEIKQEIAEMNCGEERRQQMRVNLEETTDGLR